MAFVEHFNLAVVLATDGTRNQAKPETIVPYRKVGLSGDSNLLDFDELPETCFVSRWGDDHGDYEDQNSLHKSYLKCARLSQVAANDAAVFLSGTYPGSKRTKKGRSPSPSIAANASITNEVLVMSSSSAESTFKKAQYHSFTFTFPRAEFNLDTSTHESCTYRQLLEIRQCGLQRSGALSLSKDLQSFDTFDSVEICTGMCLFSEPDLNACIDNGSIRPKMLARQPFSLSEMDIIIRLSTTIANMAALYIYGAKTARTSPMRINIDIPCIQYYQNAIESFESSLCSASDVLEWFTAIKKRRLLLFRAFRNAIEYALHQRGLKEDKVDISLSCGLKAAEEVVLRNVLTAQASVNWIQDILSAIREDGDEFWEEAISLQEEKERDPCSWRQFCTLSYVYEVLKPVLRARTAKRLFSADHGVEENAQTHQTAIPMSKSAPPSPKSSANRDGYFDSTNSSTSTPPRRVLILAIDDQDESRIYTKAGRCLTQLNTYTARSPGAGPTTSVPTIARILTVYPAPQIVVGTFRPGSNWRRPSLWRASLRNESNVGGELRFQDGDGSLETCSGLLKKVYDADLVDNLSGWLRR